MPDEVRDFFAAVICRASTAKKTYLSPQAQEVLWQYDRCNFALAALHELGREESTVLATISSHDSACIIWRLHASHVLHVIFER
jgi:hypothetical protein